MLADSYYGAGASGAVAETSEANNLAVIRGLSVTGANPTARETRGALTPRALSPKE